MNQRMYGEWYANSIRLDSLYRDTPVGGSSRQEIRSKAREFAKEAEALKKRKKRSDKRLSRRRVNPVTTMTDDMMKGNDITI